MDDLSRLQLDDEKRKKRTEEEISDLEEITGPDLCRMIAQERSPVLSSRRCGASVSHILLNSSFTYPNIQLEQLATNALRSPESIVGCHLLDQGNRLGRELRLSCTRLQSVLPEQAEELTMPTRDPSLAGRGKALVSRSEPSWREPPGETDRSSDRRGGWPVDGG